MTHPAFLRLPLETLLPFAHDGRACRSFDHLIFSRVGSLLLVPVWAVVGDLRQVVDGCPVPWQEVCDVLDAQEAGGDAPAAVRDRVREQVVDLCRRHPVYR